MLAPTLSSLARTHTVTPLLPSALPDYFRPSSLPSTPSPSPPAGSSDTDPPSSPGEDPPEAPTSPLPSSPPSLTSSSPPSLQSILKTPGKRRPSQQHRVGWLDALVWDSQQGRQF